MMPDKCSMIKEGKPCVSPPQFIVSVITDSNEEYMVGLTCQTHRQIVSGKITVMQNEGRMHGGKVNFSPVKAVGTDCVHGNEDDFVQIDMNRTKLK